jgi:carbon monoxide dehydrogenase subunit G
MHIQGKSVIIPANREKVFNYLSDFNNIKELMPEHVTDWKTDGETCSFVIKGIGHFGMKYARKEAPSLIEMAPHGKAPVSFSLIINLKEQSGNTLAEGEVNANINPFMAMMAKRPLENLINEITTKLKEKL